MQALSEAVARLNPERILIIKPSSLGDVVHALPILPALRALLPGAHVAWVVNSSLRSLLEGHPELDQVITYDKGASGLTARGLVGLSRLCASLARNRFDLTIDLQGLLRSGLMTAAAGSPVRVGLDDAREGARFFYTHRVAASRTSVHAVDRVMIMAKALGVEAPRPEFSLPISARDDEWARRTLTGVPGPRLILNMGARWESKRWPVECFAEIARRANAEFGAGIVAVGAGEDQPLADALKRHLGAVPMIDLCGRTSLLQLAALARAGDLFLSNDTGPIHLAAAVGAAVVGIYTSTDPALTGPHGPNATVAQGRAQRSASHYKRKKRDRADGRSEITVDRVWYIVTPRLRRAMGSAA